MVMRPAPSVGTLHAEVRRNKTELAGKIADVDAEMARVVARMQEKKAWSRLDEVKREEEEAQATDMELQRQAAAKEEEARRRRAAAQARAAKAAAALHEQRAKEEALEELRMREKEAEWARMEEARQKASKGQKAKDHALSSRTPRSARSRPEPSVSEAPQPAATGLFEEGGAASLLGGLFGGLLGAVTPPDSPPVKNEASPANTGGKTPEDELAAVCAEYKDAERQVQQLKATGGMALQEANEALKEVKKGYRLAQAEYERSREPGAGITNRVAGSPASNVSARRLERHGARMNARGGGGG